MRRRSPIRRHLPHLMRSSALSRRRRVSSSALPPIAQGCVSKRLTGTPCARAAGARSSGATSAQAAAEAIVPVVRLIAGVMDNSGSRPSLSRAGWPPDISGSRTIPGVSLRRSYHKHRMVICIGWRGSVETRRRAPCLACANRVRRSPQSPRALRHGRRAGSEANAQSELRAGSGCSRRPPLDWCPAPEPRCRSLARSARGRHCP